MKKKRLPHLLSLLILWPVLAISAPMDEFLTAMPGHAPYHGELEVGYDVVNDAVDLFNVREGQLDARGDTIGNYSGAHIRGKLALSKRLGIDAALWKRGLKTPHDDGESIAWQAGGQYQATVNLAWLPAIALRFSSWGDSTDQVLKNSPTRLFDRDFTTTRAIRVEDPEDLQFQGDIIGSWAIANHTLFSLFVSLGKSNIDVGRVIVKLPEEITYNDATISIPDSIPEECEFEITASSDSINLTPFNDTAGVCRRFSTQNSTGIPDDMYIRYSATYLQLGGSLQWFNDDWRARLGYRFQKLNRNQVDDAIPIYQHTSDKTVYDTNHHLTADLGYRILDKTGVFIRGHLLQHQFLGDVPFAYNLYSSHKFKNRYGFLTFGLVHGF